MIISLKKAFESSVSDNYKAAILSSAFTAKKHNIQIYLIGGIVRDLILNNIDLMPISGTAFLEELESCQYNPAPHTSACEEPPSKCSFKDIDIAVESDAVNFCKILEKEIHCKIISLQENLRTAKVRFNNGAEIDFASTREEKYSQAGAMPIAYNFGCPLKSDVKRRDFTANTLALNLNDNNNFSVIDYFNGYNDIQNKQLKVLHNKSFIDDPSRIIRALKFQARFNFNIEKETLLLMQKYLENVNIDMPLERIKNELIQYFSIEKPGLYNKLIETKAYRLFSDNPILIMDENIIKDLLTYNLFNKKDLWFIYFVLLIIKSDYSTKKLNLSSVENKIIKETEILLKDLNTQTNAAPASMDNSFLLSKYSADDKISIYKKFNDKNNISSSIYYIITQDEAYKEFLDNLKQIKVLLNGKDLIKIGLNPSPYFGRIFETILKEKCEGRLKTKQEEIEFVKKLIKKGE